MPDVGTHGRGALCRVFQILAHGKGSIHLSALGRHSSLSLTPALSLTLQTTAATPTAAPTACLNLRPRRRADRPAGPHRRSAPSPNPATTGASPRRPEPWPRGPPVPTRRGRALGEAAAGAPVAASSRPSQRAPPPPPEVFFKFLVSLISFLS